MSLVQDFELATKNVQNPNAKIRREAEVILKNFTNHPDALNVCKQLLENSTDSNVQFHAATTIKEIVTRNSFKQALDERKNWVHYLIEYSINRYANILHHVRGAILQTIAISTKLSWLDSNDLIKVDVMNTISNLMANPTYVSRKLGLAFLSAILIEFESTKASSIGLSLDFHHSCQTSFQKSHMIPIFQMVLQCLHDNVQSRSNPNASGNTPHQIEELIGSSLHCADKILCWDYSTNATSLFKNKDEIYLDNQTPSLKLSIEWKNVLLTPEVLHLFFQLSAIYFNEPAMCSRPIKCLTQLAGVHGSVFETEEVQRSYITTYMAGFKVYLSNVFQAISTSNSPIDMADKIFGLSQIAKQLFRRTSFKLLCSIPDILCVLRDLGSVAILCLKLKPENEDDTWFLDATDDMLLMWASFVEKLEAFSAIEIQEMLSNPEISAVMTLIAQVSSEISKIYIDTHVLLIPIKPDDEDSFEYEQKDLDICSDQLLNIGVLARVQPTDILIQLINLINEKHQQLKNLLAIPSNTDVLDLQEQIHWAVIISGHILADSGIGETPMIPRKILEVSAGSQQGSDPVTTLPSIILSILGTLTVSSDSIEYQNCSPLLLDSLLWFVERWSASYLFAQPSDYSNLSLSLQQSFGEAAGGCQVLDYLLVNIELQSKNWIAEIDIMSQIIIVLQGLSKNRAALNLMVQNAAFSRIVEFLLFNTAKLPASTHSPIVQMIAFVATRATDPTVKSNYFKCLSDAIENSLNSILHHPEFSKNHQHTLTREQIIISLEMFDGLALSIEDETTVLIFETIGRNFNSFIKLLDIYHEFPNMEVYILQIFKNLIRLQVYFFLLLQF
ncbi:armadillo-type protein [Globomyces pollinis-pini]|nr:armadillo-type protein [Globomyces pollinis-pini]